MSKKYKYIYWRPDLERNDKGLLFANVHILIGHNKGSITDLQKMADEIIETFPQATYDEICGGKVFHFSRVMGFTIVTWNMFLPAREYPGWNQVKDGKIKYC